MIETNKLDDIISYYGVEEIETRLNNISSRRHRRYFGRNATKPPINSVVDKSMPSNGFSKNKIARLSFEPNKSVLTLILSMLLRIMAVKQDIHKESGFNKKSKNLFYN